MTTRTPQTRTTVIRTIASAMLVVLLVHAASAAPAPLKPQMGPVTVTLGDNLATLKVPKGFGFFGKDDTIKLVSQGGVKASGNEIGALVKADDNDFAMLLRYEAIGHVRDDDASKLDANAMLNDFKEGTAEANEERKKNGVPPLEVIRWTKPPAYDATRHFITYGLEARSAGEPVLNCDTQMLGRSGILTVKLITSPEKLEKAQPQADTVIKALEFKEGQRYTDFQPGKDKDSGVGLRDIVLGGAGIALASKLGLFAKFGKLLIWLLVAFKKVGILIIAAFVGLFKKLFGGRADTPPPDGSNDASGG